nr:hypothetical protein [Tanacetum cinerariifolium]
MGVNLDTSMTNMTSGVYTFRAHEVELDQRNYNLSTTSEVAGIWIEGNNNIIAYKRDIVVYERSDYPTQIQPYFASYDLLSYVFFFPKESELGKVFRHNIRAYNTNFSFTSMGVNLNTSMTNMTSGVYTFCAHEGMYHKIDQLVMRDGQPRVTLNASVELDQRNYNLSTTSEVAGIWIEGNNNIIAYKRDIVVYERSDYPTQIQPYFASYDLLSYVFFFPKGKPGWHSKIPRVGVSIDEIIKDEEHMEECNTPIFDI